MLYSSSARLMNSVPLSLSRPNMRNGSSARRRCNAWKTVSWRLSRSPAQATQPVATSTMLSVYRNWPAPLQPAVGDQVHFEEPGPRFGPIRKRPNGDLPLQQRASFGGADATPRLGVLAQRLECAI